MAFRKKRDSNLKNLRNYQIDNLSISNWLRSSSLSPGLPSLFYSNYKLTVSCSSNKPGFIEVLDENLLKGG